MIQKLPVREAAPSCLRRNSPNTVANEPGNQKIVAVNRPPGALLMSGRLRAAVNGASVLTVRVSVKGPVPSMVRLGGAKVQETCFGSVPQVNVMVPV